MLKALDKDRSRRYETANGLAADVQRYLADEAVQACPPSAGYRLRKLARRNKGVLATAALLGVVLLAAVGAVAGTVGWNVRERAARQAANEIEVELALREATQLAEHKRWPEALSAARRADGLLAGGGSNDLRQRVRELRQDLEMVLRLEDVRAAAAERVAKDGFDWVSVDQEYTAAFQEYGIDIPRLAVEVAARRLRTRGVPAELAAALDHWAWVRRLAWPGDEPGRKRLYAVGRAVDPDPWRNRVREALQQQDRKSLTDLAARDEVAALPPMTLDLLGKSLKDVGALEQAISLLRIARQQHPADFWINFELALCFHSLRPPQPVEAIRFYTAPVALRGQSAGTHSNLGAALRGKGQLDEAIAEFRAAVRLKPDLAEAHTNLGVALATKQAWGEAIAEYSKAIKLGSKTADPQNNLAMLLATCPEAKFRDPRRALEPAKQAVELAPKTGIYWNTLGIAQYAAGDCKAAIEALDKSMELRQGGDANDWFFMAMARWRLGDKKDARKWYGRAVKWMEKNDPKNEELTRFHAEAEKLLELKK